MNKITNAIGSLFRKITTSNNQVHPPNDAARIDMSRENSIKEAEQDSKRMTIQDLIKYEERVGKSDYEVMEESIKTVSVDPDAKKHFEGFGWIKGVLMRCVLCIFGATLFLRMSWIAGQIGIVLGTGVIVLSLVIVVLTAISMSAIVTNGEVKSGGCYYLVSRSLGPEYGGAIGLIFYIANIVNAAMNCVGLAEDIVFKNYLPVIFDGGINDIRIYAGAICTILQAIIFIGTEFENKTQLLLTVSIIISLISHFVGTVMPSTPSQLLSGISGYSLSTFTGNLWPDGHNRETFIAAFGVFFPAMTGIMGGANMSGDLKDPSKAIPKGTMWAIVVTIITYFWCMIVTAATTVRDADCVTPPFDADGNYVMPDCVFNSTCKCGLANDFTIMAQQGAWSPLITLGVIATTLSSASGCLIGAPRVFQALCADKLYPGIFFFAKGHGSNNDPFRAYFLTYFAAMAVIGIGELNPIAELITLFFLAAFAITNFSTFDATLAKAPGFRPTFKYYNKWLSLIGAILCVVTMFIMNWWESLGTLIIFIVLFMYLKYNKTDVNWGSSTDANRYRKALIGLIKIARQSEHVKNYRPQVLVLSGNPAARQALVDFAHSITKGTNLLVCGHVIPYTSSVAATECIRKLNDRYTDWMREQKIKAFYCGVAHTSLREGVQMLMQAVGLGKMQPNILLIGYKDQWRTTLKDEPKNYIEYTGVIADAFEANMSLCIFRNGDQGLDHSAMYANNDENLFIQLPSEMLADSALHDDMSRGIARRNVRPKAMATPKRIASNSNMNKLDVASSLSLPMSVGRNTSESMSASKHAKATVAGKNLRYRSRFPSGFVDVWFTYDDGGLTFLLSHLLTSRSSFLENGKLRFFTICSRGADAEAVRDNLQLMLKKFRIPHREVFVIIEAERDLYQETVDEYETSIADINDDEIRVSDEVLERCHKRTHAVLRQREYLLEHSSASSFIITTLPVAAADIVMSPLYMLWLQLLSEELPPMLFVRGNHSSVMTYYS
uniref:Solute carrier family 12 member 3 n=1 Tax=Panagrellus redivivus TaxID=6233 RepID=A0A7E4VI10_PANRE